MKLIIDTDIIDSESITLNQFLYLLLLDNKFTAGEVRDLDTMGLTVNGNIKESTSQKIGELLNKMKESPTSENALENLATTLMNLYPGGKKDGTNYYWRGNKKEIKDKLKKFFIYFGNNYSYTDIIKATEKYVNSFNGNYSYMRLLKYFIWKQDVKRNLKEGEHCSVEQVSDLASYIENMGQENIDNDWTTQLV